MSQPPWKKIEVKNSLIGSGAAVGILAAIFYFTKRIEPPLLWFLAGAGWICFFIWNVAEEYIGKRKHGQFIHDKRSRWFYDNGFVIENRGFYWGLKGIYRGYFCRLFFNWETNLPKRTYELTMMIYHAPCLKSNGEIDIPRLDKLNAHLKPGVFSTLRTRMMAEVAYVIYHTPIMWGTSRKMMQKRLDKAIDTCVKYQLRPISEDQVGELIAEDPYLHGPDINVFQENFIERS